MSRRYSALPRGPLALMLAVFALTRLLLLWSANHPDQYAPGGAPFVADVDLFGGYAAQIVDGDLAPYSGVAIEYLPGALPFIVLPQLVASDSVSYREAFFALMFLVDVVGLWGLLLLARRRGSTLGVWLWVVLVALLGPLAYARLDLVPAVATIWAVERASARDPFGTGAALGLGAVVKLYPALLMPAALLTSTRRRRFSAGVVAFVVLPLLPIAGSLSDMFQQAVADQAGRGIHIESTWGSLLLLASKLGYPTSIVSSFSTLQFEGPVPDLMRTLSLALTVAAVVAGSWVARKDRWRGRASWLGAVMFAMLATILGVSMLFSPQYVLWLFGLGAAAASTRGSPVALTVALLLPVAAATQVLYPLIYAQILASELAALLLLTARNLLVLATGLLAFWALARRTGDAAVPTVERGLPA